MKEVNDILFSMLSHQWVTPTFLCISYVIGRLITITDTQQINQKAEQWRFLFLFPSLSLSSPPLAFYTIDLSRKREDEPCFGTHLEHLKNHLAHRSLKPESIRADHLFHKQRQVRASRRPEMSQGITLNVSNDTNKVFFMKLSETITAGLCMPQRHSMAGFTKTRTTVILIPL